MRQVTFSAELASNCQYGSSERFNRTRAPSVTIQASIPSIRAIIADEENPARNNRQLLDAEPGVQVVAECLDGEQVITAVQTFRPDLLLLNIQLSDLDGFQVLERIPADQRPLVVFTSSHDQYAIRAFEANALDYLLKPFTQERLHRAVQKVRMELLKSKPLTSQVVLEWLAQSKAAPSSVDRRFMIKARGRLLFLDFDEIDWIEAAANYVKLNVGGNSYLLREGRIFQLDLLEAKVVQPIHFNELHSEHVIHPQGVGQVPRDIAVIGPLHSQIHFV